MGKHSATTGHTSLSQTQLVALRRDGHEAALTGGVFVDPHVISQCEQVLDRRGEDWAASVLGRDISRRSLAVAHRPFLNAGEDHTLVAADRAEDQVAIDHLDPTENGGSGSSSPGVNHQH